MAINDIYMLTFVQSFGLGGEEVQTNWFYRAVDAGGTAEALHAAWGDPAGMLGLYCDTQTQFMKNKLIRVINLFSLTDFYEEGINGGGGFTGDTLPAFATMRYSLKLNTRGIKPGSKRVPGVPESVQVDGVITNETEIANMNLLANGMAQNIGGIDDVPEFEPVVVKRIKTLVPADGDKPAYYKYSLPDNSEDLNYGKVVAALANTRVGHQVSRGNGR